MEQIGNYRILGTIGRGGMATVFRVLHVSRGTVHALKLFDATDSSRKELLAKRFCAEARLTSELDHPNIAKTVDYGLLDDDRPYLVMDCIGSGKTLADAMATHPLSPDDTQRLYHQIRSALAYCHSRGVIHADLKAENILLHDDGRFILSDFGIARVLQPELRKAVSLTASTLPVNLGTPYTLAPECARGELATPASDIYAFGVLLFKLTTGIWYEGSVRLLKQLDGLAPEWATLLRHMLQADPARRPHDASCLPTSPLSRRSRGLLVASALGLVLTAALLGLGGWYVSSRPTTPSGPRATPANEIKGGYVPYAVLTPDDSLVLTGAVHFGTVVLPDTNGYVHVRAPRDFSGPIITADHAEGSLFSQFHIDRDPGMRVLIRGNSEIIIKRQ